MRIVFFGVDELGTRCLAGLLAQGRHEIVGVVSLPGFEPPEDKRPFWSRLLARQAPEPRSVEGLARTHRLPLWLPPTLRGPEFAPAIAALAPDLIVVACFDKILPADLLGAARLGGVNVHPSLLPRLRGPAPASRAIFGGERTSGVTVHQMEATVDTGAILVQREVEIGPRDTAGALFARLSRLAPGVLLEAIEGLESGQLVPRPQEGTVTMAPFLTREEAHLDWQASCEQIDRVVRSGNPYPGAFLETGQTLIAVLAAERESRETRFAPGSVLRVDDAGIVVQAGDGTLRLGVLRAGGHLLQPRDYPHHFMPGQVLVSGQWSRSAVGPTPERAGRD